MAIQEARGILVAKERETRQAVRDAKVAALEHFVQMQTGNSADQLLASSYGFDPYWLKPKDKALVPEGRRSVPNHPSFQQTAGMATRSSCLRPALFQAPKAPYNYFQQMGYGGLDVPGPYITPTGMGGPYPVPVLHQSINPPTPPASAPPARNWAPPVQQEPPAAAAIPPMNQQMGRGGNRGYQGPPSTRPSGPAWHPQPDPTKRAVPHAPGESKNPYVNKTLPLPNQPICF